MQTYMDKKKASATVTPLEAAPTPSQMLRMSGAGAPQPMSAALRAKFEPAFGADFSSVRISRGHIPTGLGVQAVAKGTDILVDSRAPDAVLGHELAHVVQQAQGRVANGGYPVVHNAALEHEADVQGARAAAGTNAYDSGGIGGGDLLSIAPMSSASAPAQCKMFSDKESDEATAAVNKISAESQAGEAAYQAALERYTKSGSTYQPATSHQDRYLRRHLRDVEDPEEQDRIFKAFAEGDKKTMGSYVREDILHAMDTSGMGNPMEKADLTSKSNKEVFQALGKYGSLSKDLMSVSDMTKENGGLLSLEDLNLGENTMGAFRVMNSNLSNDVGEAQRLARGASRQDQVLDSREHDAQFDREKLKRTQGYRAKRRAGIQARQAEAELNAPKKKGFFSRIFGKK